MAYLLKYHKTRCAYATPSIFRLCGWHQERWWNHTNFLHNERRTCLSPAQLLNLCLRLNSSAEIDTKILNLELAPNRFSTARTLCGLQKCRQAITWTKAKISYRFYRRLTNSSPKAIFASDTMHWALGNKSKLPYDFLCSFVSLFYCFINGIPKFSSSFSISYPFQVSLN